MGQQDSMIALIKKEKCGENKFCKLPKFNNVFDHSHSTAQMIFSNQSSSLMYEKIIE